MSINHLLGGYWIFESTLLILRLHDMVFVLNGTAPLFDDSEIYNGAQGEIVGVVFDEHEPPIDPNGSQIQLQHPSGY